MAIYGIDFGYSKACIATLDSNGYPVVIRNLRDGSDELATALFFESADNVVIGSCAKEMIETDGERVIQFVKRDLGQSNTRTYEFDGKTYTPEEISAFILLRLKQMVEEQGESVKDVVVAVPSYFGLEKKVALKNATELAGFNLIGVIAEPTAAGLAYLCNHDQTNQIILVFDLGSVSLDISILQNVNKTENSSWTPSLQILCIDGSDRLGGESWSDRLFDFILQACCDENGLTSDEIDVETRQMIRSRVETIKKKLNIAEFARARINVNGTMTTIDISREEFENLTSDKVAQTMTCVENVLQKASNIEIDTVLLVGGATRMPMIHDLMEKRFPGKVRSFEPEHSVAIGAAIYGQMINDN
ncbi:Hsp70 family protein [Eubacteriaceae bacterium ES3]|nr:Hsp70 family protein [Eubacteriaceae bacterium ES3]